MPGVRTKITPIPRTPTATAITREPQKSRQTRRACSSLKLRPRFSFQRPRHFPAKHWRKANTDCGKGYVIFDPVLTLINPLATISIASVTISSTVVPTASTIIIFDTPFALRNNRPLTSTCSTLATCFTEQDTTSLVLGAESRWDCYQNRHQ